MKITPAPIILIPNPHLRRVAKMVSIDTPNLALLTKKLAETLHQTKNPTGVGLAAPQIDQDWRIFATQLDNQIELYINPIITAHSDVISFGEKEEDPDLEGCLSIPKLYGAVPRWSWVELEFDSLAENRLKRNKRRFSDFPARVVQHEQDHLNGVLFIDYSLKLELPVYSADSRSDKMTEIPRDIFETLHQTTLATP